MIQWKNICYFNRNYTYMAESQIYSLQGRIRKIGEECRESGTIDPIMQQRIQDMHDEINSLPESSEKDRIVALFRSDLSHVCEDSQVGLRNLKLVCDPQIK